MEQLQFKKPLSNMQLELLGFFSRDVEETDLLEMKRMIVNYLAKKVTKLADKVWEEKKWTAKDMDELLNIHERTSYNLI